LADGTSGALTARYEYGPFGEAIRTTGPGTTPMAEKNPFRFSTKYTDDQSRFLYYGHRYYNPTSGRWLSRDPIGEAGFANLRLSIRMEDTGQPYTFVSNAPVIKHDSLGQLEATEGSVSTWKCGGFLHTFKFLTGPAEVTGFIIQEVKWVFTGSTCSGGKLPGYPIEKTWYEAFEIKDGENPKDNWSHPTAPSNSYGHKAVFGKAAFFWIGQLPPTMRPGNVREALTMPSSYSPPPFWDQQADWISNYVTRVLRVSWLCCCGTSKTDGWVQ